MAEGKQAEGGGPFRYSAFISYSRKDAPFALWLHRKLESLRFPVKDGRQPIRDRNHPLRPAFRDIDELAASGDLGESIRRALEASGALIVLCSPTAAASPWVNKEIQYFLLLGRHEHILPVLLEGSPVHAGPGAPANAAFPAALKEDPSEPLWIDARKGTESRERIFARIAAGLLNVSFDQVWKRQQRQARNRTVAAIAAGLVVGLPLAAFGWEFSQPIQIGACPLDKVVFEAGWLKGQDVSHRFAVSRVGVRYWANCEDGQKPWTDALASDINCRGPYGETVFEGEYRSPGDAATREDIYPTWSIEPAAPCCMWNIFGKETADEIITDETFRWYSPGRAPLLSTLPFNSIEVDRYSTNEFESENLGLENELPASACAVDFAGRFGMFTTRVTGWFAPKVPDEVLEEETPP